MKIDFCSDMHADIWQNYKFDFYYDFNKNQSDMLIIAGDISNSIDSTHKFILYAKQFYDYVLFVHGNHEYYNHNELITDLRQDSIDLEKSNKNIYYLHNKKELIIDNTLFIGDTGWYDWNAYIHHGISYNIAKYSWSKMMNDASINFNKDPDILALETAHSLANIVSKYQNDNNIKKIVVVTHTVPLERLCVYNPNNYQWNCLTPSYINTHMEKVIKNDINKKIKIWHYGHTHDRKTIKIDHINFINNSRGYPNENCKFQLIDREI